MADLGPPIISAVVQWLLGPGLRIALILILALVAYRLAKRAIPRVMATAVRKGLPGWQEEEVTKRADTLSHVVTKTVAVALMAGTVFTALAELEVYIGPILAGVGVAGIAIGFGAQSLVKDVVNGLFIVLENQFGKGDVVKIAGVSGLVEEVNLRRTVLRDLDGTVHTIPNGEIRVASNLTREWSRVNINIPVAYAENLNHVATVINRVGRELAEDDAFGPLILEPPQVLRVDSFEESGISIKVLGVTKPIKQWVVAGEFRKRIKEAFDHEGIEIPFPHRVIVNAKNNGGTAKKKDSKGNPSPLPEGDPPGTQTKNKLERS
ncbi:MAG: mechanosensitive ion channel family protein [Dehalococcoidia bacterium]|nr:mechanosensitive ion channel family protein [Dehalococcoidia bacterium]